MTELQWKLLEAVAKWIMYNTRYREKFLDNPYWPDIEKVLYQIEGEVK